jgi:hypothetical protein
MAVTMVMIFLRFFLALILKLCTKASWASLNLSLFFNPKASSLRHIKPFH